MNGLFTFAFDPATFDWISIAFWVIVGIRVIMGFWNGGFKTLMKIIIVAAAVGLSFALCKVVGAWMGDLGLRKSIQDALYDTLSKSNEALATEFTNAKLDTAYAGWIALGNVGTKQDMIVQLLHQGYSSMYIPSGIYTTLDNMILAGIPAETDLTTTFTFASIISTNVANAALIGIGFLTIFLAVFIVGMIIIALFSRASKLAGKKPSFGNRLLGIVIGLGYAFIICWSASIGIKSLMTAFPVFNDFVNNSMQLENDSYWNIGKFFININFGYSDLLNWFLSLVSSTASSTSATSSASSI
ncbi:MAG: hypothetical protein K6B65_05730 [Bacilli bacterium]|nr:hypothetical protein [Bacilli bacterium]